MKSGVREGDGLNQSIRKSEKEIRMLTKTLEHLMGRNQVYRQSFHKVLATLIRSF